MAGSRVYVVVLAVIAIVMSLVSPSVQGQSLAPAPAPSNDGKSIDQGIAYMLMVMALVLTYLIHPLDASSFFF